MKDSLSRYVQSSEAAYLIAPKQAAVALLVVLKKSRL